MFTKICKIYGYENIQLSLTVNPLSAKFIKWSNTLKQIVGKLPTICLSVFDHFSGLAFKRLSELNNFPQTFYVIFPSTIPIYLHRDFTTVDVHK